MDQIQPNHQTGSQGKQLSTETCDEEEVFKCRAWDRAFQRAVARDPKVRMHMAFSKGNCMH